MSHSVKYIASFSDDAIHNAIELAVGADKERFIDMLKTVQSVLEKLLEKPKKESKIICLSDKQYLSKKYGFKLEEHDRLETVSKDVEWKVRFDFFGRLRDAHYRRIEEAPCSDSGRRKKIFLASTL